MNKRTILIDPETLKPELEKLKEEKCFWGIDGTSVNVEKDYKELTEIYPRRDTHLIVSEYNLIWVE